MFRYKIILNFIERDLKIAFSYKASFLGKIFSLFFLISIFYYISLNTANSANRYFSYILIGLAYTTVIRTALFHLSNQLEQEQTAGTIGYSFTVPHSLTEYLLGTSITGFITSWIEALLYIFIGTTVFNASISINIGNIMHLITVILLGTFSLWGLGIITAAITLLTKKGNSISWLMTALIILSGNVFFSSDLLPKSLVVLSNLNPVKHALLILRALTTNSDSGTETFSYIFLLAFSLVSISAGILCFKNALKRVKIKGTLEHF
jgi:ABC-2 type transport system permease protein